MGTETFGFKNWQELNDEARQELEEELAAQFVEELDIVMYRAIADWLGDLVDAFDMPQEEAVDFAEAVLSVFFDEREHLGGDVDDLWTHVDEFIDEINESDAEARAVAERIWEQRSINE